MVFDTSEQCRKALDALLLRYTDLVNGVGNDDNHANYRQFIIYTIMRNLTNNDISLVRFDTHLSFASINEGQCYNLFTEIANAISGRRVTLQQREHGKDERWIRPQAKRYVYSWDIAPYSCKFFTKNMNNSYLQFYMEIRDLSKEPNDDLDSDAGTDAEDLHSMFTILQNMHDRVTRLESSLPSTRPSIIACPRRLE